MFKKCVIVPPNRDSGNSQSGIAARATRRLGLSEIRSLRQYLIDDGFLGEARPLLQRWLAEGPPEEEVQGEKTSSTATPESADASGTSQQRPPSSSSADLSALASVLACHGLRDQLRRAHLHGEPVTVVVATPLRDEVAGEDAAELRRAAFLQLDAVLYALPRHFLGSLADAAKGTTAALMPPQGAVAAGGKGTNASETAHRCANAARTLRAVDMASGILAPWMTGALYTALDRSSTSESRNGSGSGPTGDALHVLWNRMSPALRMEALSALEPFLTGGSRSSDPRDRLAKACYVRGVVDAALRVGPAPEDPMSAAAVALLGRYVAPSSGTSRLVIRLAVSLVVAEHAVDRFVLGCTGPSRCISNDDDDATPSAEIGRRAVGAAGSPHQQAGAPSKPPQKTRGGKVSAADKKAAKLMSRKKKAEVDEDDDAVDEEAAAADGGSGDDRSSKGEAAGGAAAGAPMARSADGEDPAAAAAQIPRRFRAAAAPTVDVATYHLPGDGFSALAADVDLGGAFTLRFVDIVFINHVPWIVFPHWPKLSSSSSESSRPLLSASAMQPLLFGVLEDYQPSAGIPPNFAAYDRALLSRATTLSAVETAAPSRSGGGSDPKPLRASRFFPRLDAAMRLPETALTAPAWAPMSAMPTLFGPLLTLATIADALEEDPPTLTTPTAVLSTADDVAMAIVHLAVAASRDEATRADGKDDESDELPTTGSSGDEQDRSGCPADADEPSTLAQAASVPVAKADVGTLASAVAGAEEDASIASDGGPREDWITAGPFEKLKAAMSARMLLHLLHGAKNLPHEDVASDDTTGAVFDRILDVAAAKPFTAGGALMTEGLTHAWLLLAHLWAAPPSLGPAGRHGPTAALPWYVLCNPAATDFVVERGADLMWPGVREAHWEGTERIDDTRTPSSRTPPAGAAAWARRHLPLPLHCAFIVPLGHGGPPIAVGSILPPIADGPAHTGVAVRVFHVVGDGLWSGAVEPFIDEQRRRASAAPPSCGFPSWETFVAPLRASTDWRVRLAALFGTRRAARAEASSPFPTGWPSAWGHSAAERTPSARRLPSHQVTRGFPRVATVLQHMARVAVAQQLAPPAAAAIDSLVVDVAPRARGCGVTTASAILPWLPRTLPAGSDDPSSPETMLRACLPTQVSHVDLFSLFTVVEGLRRLSKAQLPVLVSRFVSDMVARATPCVPDEREGDVRGELRDCLTAMRLLATGGGEANGDDDAAQLLLVQRRGAVWKSATDVLRFLSNDANKVCCLSHVAKVPVAATWQAAQVDAVAASSSPAPLWIVFVDRSTASPIMRAHAPLYHRPITREFATGAVDSLMGELRTLGHSLSPSVHRRLFTNHDVRLLLDVFQRVTPHDAAGPLPSLLELIGDVAGCSHRWRSEPLSAGEDATHVSEAAAVDAHQSCGAHTEGSGALIAVSAVEPLLAAPRDLSDGLCALFWGRSVQEQDAGIFDVNSVPLDGAARDDRGRLLITAKDVRTRLDAYCRRHSLLGGGTAAKAKGGTPTMAATPGPVTPAGHVRIDLLLQLLWKGGAATVAAGSSLPFPALVARVVDQVLLPIFVVRRSRADRQGLPLQTLFVSGAAPSVHLVSESRKGHGVVRIIGLSRSFGLNLEQVAALAKTKLATSAAVVGANDKAATAGGVAVGDEIVVNSGTSATFIKRLRALLTTDFGIPDELIYTR